MKHNILLLVIILFSSSSSWTQSLAELEDQVEVEIGNGNYEAAYETCEKGLLLDSTSIHFLFAKGYIFGATGRLQEALDLYTYTISLYPESPQPYNERAAFLQAVREYEYAQADYDKAVQFSKTDEERASYISNRATAKLNIRDFMGAYKDLQIAHSLDSTNIGVLMNLGNVCDEAGKGDETLFYLNKIIDLDPEYYLVYGTIGFKYQELGMHNKAIENYNIVLKNDPNDPLGYSNRSYNRLKLNDIDGAMKDINKSLEIFPTNSYAYRIRALIYIELGKDAKACQDIQKALELGFTKEYGGEMEELSTTYCESIKN